MTQPIENVRKPIKEVRWADLERCTPGNLKSKCPICDEGTLPMRRDESHSLMAEDMCTFCGQQFRYTDIDELKKAYG